MRLIVEIEGQAPEPIGGEGALIAFMSFAVMRGFGAQHPLIALADRLHSEHRLRLGPLTTFYEATPEDAEDRQKLELAWQDAEALRDSLEAMLGALATDELARTYLRRAGAETLVAETEAAAFLARQAANEGRRVRLLFEA